ncbi:hypothetical protein [Falsiphaeobacter marinintestinus]|uniref:hypothetical protein n=1 Tax=Falsiphaeobacter marinintestinus TaxID=1492905 RepID=UPI0011B5EEA4|nr:hypothetical protein [Phaeobacter marinintestinus]
MPLIARWHDIETHYPDGLTPAEKQLVAACKAGGDLGAGTFGGRAGCSSSPAGWSRHWARLRSSG